ncbi:MAG: sulfurtransferase [Hydrogenophilales bacterium CG17_big_fil_post_rev_8_21_14_2_50_63_12]|nr:MAG: sulfurtransferase [Hydrogenophilales bacterium CG17_big_fil_post_rev_8_21_14_2_50_63_12]PIX96669.1 MAG: sulfurtransferase [Hydrogenophilales bacterium CG_4_10_14_3_um_filter_63_21]PJB03537.1 MAG: sulfurtransferase [Hydrogenophilales bacterium CG_4_9_14_3_um_filter_63_34]
MRAFLIALAVGLFALNAQAVDPASVPKIKISKLGLYLEARDVPAFLKAHAPRVLFVDVRTIEELLFVGVPDGLDGQASFGIMHYDKWDEKKDTFPRNPNPDFLSQFELWTLDKGIEKSDPIVLICRSGDRSALSADLLARHGYTNVWSVVDGFEGDLAKDGPNKGQRVVNGWKNAGLPWSYKLDKNKITLSK